MEVAPHFRLTEEQALVVLQQVTRATRRWQTVAHQVGLDHAAVEQMAPAFEHEQAELARAITGP
jgi:serine/threonine-protein kinase HipA